MTFLFNILRAVTFLHVLHLDVLRGQIEIETESKNLMYGYIHSTTVLCDRGITLLSVVGKVFCEVQYCSDTRYNAFAF